MGWIWAMFFAALTVKKYVAAGGGTEDYYEYLYESGYSASAEC